ncbi:MAG: twitching motility protein PilT [Thaumarchaeota archaeon]|nr:twitching motility protein PilT [Nitrososphaerota archaeon]
MVKVVCDTSFLMAVASKKIKNITSVDTEIGDLEFVVPNLVMGELERISKGNSKKKSSALGALEISQDLEKIKISGTSVDEALALHVKKHRGIVATIDIELKKKIKENGGSVISLASNKIVLEQSK